MLSVDGYEGCCPCLHVNGREPSAEQRLGTNRGNGDSDTARCRGQIWRSSSSSSVRLLGLARQRTAVAAGVQKGASGAFFANRVPIEDFLAPPQAGGMTTASRAFEGVTSIP